VSILELNVKNLSRTLLTQDIGLTETSFEVADAGALPNPPFLITVEGEIMRVGSKNISTNTLSNVLRGREGTSPAPHSSGTVVENRFTAGTYDEIKQTVTSHLAENMPHLMLVDNNVYKYGFKQENGFVKFLYEEVM